MTNRDVVIDILLNLFKMEHFWGTELLLHIKLTIFEYWRQRKISMYSMSDLFTCHKDISNSIWANPFNDGTLRTTVNFASALSKLIMLKYLICLRFLQCRLFPLFVLTLKSFAEACTSTKLQDSENMHGGVSFLIILKNR